MCVLLVVDPKSVQCLYFNSGQCTKGDKFKFPHDRSVESKSSKPDLFTDARAAEEEGKDGFMLCQGPSPTDPPSHLPPSLVPKIP
jgi:hypothetical protein